MTIFYKKVNFVAKYIILDTETTGTDEEDRVIQLGYMVLGSKNIEEATLIFRSFDVCSVCTLK